MFLIKCENLAAGYEGKKVIDNLNFKVEPGQYVCIIGENGAGKSTLIKCVLGLHKPSQGKILFGEGLKQNQIGYIPQKSSAQNDFPGTVMEVVLSGCLNNHGRIAIYNKQDKLKAISNMERLGISDLKNKCFRELSGGQQQRTLMARALCATKKILFLDEPMAGLDPEASESLYMLLESLNKEGLTILMVSHDLDGVYQNASHILDLTKRKFFWGTVEEYKNA